MTGCVFLDIWSDAEEFRTTLGELHMPSGTAHSAGSHVDEASERRSSTAASVSLQQRLPYSEEIRFSLLSEPDLPFPRSKCTQLGSWEHDPGWHI